MANEIKQEDFRINSSSENFLNKVPLEKRILPRGAYKLIVLNGLTIASALGLSYTYHLFLNRLTGLSIVLIMFVLLVIFSSFETILTKSVRRRALLILVEIFALFAFFYTLPLKFLLLAVGSAAFFIILGEIQGRREASQVLKPSYFRVSRVTGTKIMTGLILVAIFMYFPKIQNADQIIPQETFGSLFNWSAGTMKRLYPEIQFQGTIDNLLETLARYEIKKNSLYYEMPIPAQELLKQSLIQERKKQFEGWLGLKTQLAGGDEVKNVLYNFTELKAKKIRDEHFQEFSVAWAILLFLIGKGIGLILIPIISILIFFIIQIFLAANFVFVAGETRTKESLTL